MDLAISKTEPSNTLSWHILLEQQADGQVTAWVAEWPDCRVVAASRETAIAALKAMLDEKGKTIEIEPLLIQPVAAETSGHPMMKFVGIFQDDPDFIAWHDRLWAEKQRNKDNDEILSVEECMQVM